MKLTEKIAILSLSLLTVIATAGIGPALSTIGIHFSSASELTLKLVLTIPALICIPVSLFTSYLTKTIAKKTLMIIGLILYTIGGVLGFFSPSIYFLIGSRALLGVGLGMLAPISLVIIGDYFEGHEKAVFMGYSSAITNLGGVIAILIVGVLATTGWRYPFLVYLIAIPVLTVIVLFLPKKARFEHIHSNDDKHIKLNKEVFKYAFMALTGYIVFYSVPTNVALLISSEKLGTPTTAGILIAIVTLCGFIIGLIFGKLLKLLHNYIPVISFLLMGLGIIPMGMGQSLLLIFIGIIFVGLGFGLVVPFAMFNASRCVHMKHAALGISIIATGIYLGEFVSPLILGFISSLLKMNNINGSFYASTIIAIIAAIIFFIDAKRTKIA